MEEPKCKICGDMGRAKPTLSEPDGEECECTKELGIMASEPHIIERRFEYSGKRSKDECYSKTEWKSFARICKNCGLPYGRHFGDYCPVEKRTLSDNAQRLHETAKKQY